MQYKKLTKVLWLCLCALTLCLPLLSQSVTWHWEPVAPGVWKAQIGASQPIDLLRAAGSRPRVDALKGLGERELPIAASDCYAELRQGRVYLRLPLQQNEHL